MPAESPESGTLPKSPRRLADSRVEPARLVVVHPPELRAVIRLGGERTVLGREREDGVVGLGHGTVSRRHFAVE